MKKETVVRQNKCDREMNFLVFGCFFFFMAMQLFVGETQQSGLVNGINMVLYMVFVPGFIFRLGYSFGGVLRQNSEEYGKKWLLKRAGWYYIYFFLLAMGNEVYLMKLPPKHSFANILTMVTIPSISAVFFTMVLILLAVCVFYKKVSALVFHKRWMLVAVILCLVCAFLRSKTDSYALMAAMFGSDVHHGVPGVPYFAFFLAGIYFEEKKPGFEWKTALAVLAVTAVSLVLYRTPLQNLCRVTASVLPVYVIYVAAELLSDLTVRFRPVRSAVDLVEIVFYGYAVGMFTLCSRNMFEGAGALKVLLLAAGMILLIYFAMLGFVFFCRVYSSVMKLLQENVRHKTAAYFMIYTAVFTFLLFVVFIDYIRYDRTFIWSGDGVAQYYPRAIYFIRYIRNLLSGFLNGNFELPMYDFKIGLGGEITYSLEPLYFLFALFGEEHVELAYNLITLLRFYMAGITSSILFLYFKKDYFTTFLASVVYVFCGFALFAGVKHTMFMIPMIMLPLLVIAMEEILKSRRWYLMTIFVAISLFSNYYFLYMNTIGLGVYFLVRFFCQQEKEKKTFRNFMIKGLTISGTYLLGVAMSCIVLATTFGLYVGSGRSGDMVIKTPSLFFYSTEWLVRCFITFITTKNAPGEWLKLGFIPIAMFAVVLLFLKKGRKELKILSVIALIFMAFPVFGFIFSGFSAVINRWCYMVALLVAFIVADCLEDLRRMSRKEIGICAIVLGIYGFLVYNGNVLTTPYTQLAFKCLAVTFAVILLCQDQYKKITARAKQSLLIVLTVVMVFCQGHSFYGMGGTVSEYVKPGIAQKSVEGTPLAAVKELGDESFYRSAMPQLKYLTISSPMVMDYNGITNFCSTLNSSVTEYLAKIGSTSYSNTQLMGLGNSAFANTLAAVKYYAYYGEKPGRPLPYGCEEVLKTEMDGEETTVCEYQYALPLGYTYEEAISEEELEQYGVLERQEVMLQKVALSSSENTGNTDAEITAEKLDITSVKESRAYLTEHELRGGMEEEETGEAVDNTDEADDGEETPKAEENEDKTYDLTLNFEGKPNSETYVVMKNAVLEGDMSEARITLTMKTEDHKISYKFASTTDRYRSGQSDYVFNLGYHEDAIDYCNIKMGSEGIIKFDSLEVYSLPMTNLEKYTDTLKQDVLEDVKIETNQVSGSISLEKDKILVLSIPFQKGWIAYVDGQETELQRANYMYMALPLSAGDHTVELHFEIPGVKYALVIMASSTGLFLLLCIVTFFGRKRKKKLKEKTVI